MRLRYLVSVGLATLAWGGLSAAVLDLEDLDRLEMQLAIFLGGEANDTGKIVAPIDRRLRLKRCAEGAVFDREQRDAIVVRCSSAGWRIRVRLLSAERRGTEIVIHRGDAVQLIDSGTGFRVANGAIAMDDGHQGSMVRVKTLTGNAIRTARVQSPGSVTLSD